MMQTEKRPSPCITCRLVANPRDCDNKDCKAWQEWFLGRWALIHAYPRQKIENTEPKPLGVNIGGTYYAAPHQVREYLAEDPCRECICTKDMCTEPCRVKRAWEEARGEVFL